MSWNLGSWLGLRKVEGVKSEDARTTFVNRRCFYLPVVVMEISL
jgi:hypothetical protein